MTEPRRRESLRPAELIGFAAVIALFAGGTIFAVTRDIALAAIVLGATFVIDLIVISMLMLAITPNKPMDGERAPDTPHD
ncbi:hypothetical protein GCM10009792_13040 [Microcella alkalica]|uniref:High-affinity Fe2+/Pb2+ permease n=1 Tax=Microcella alkalica TaxID=355930 RepID=A0A839EE48_9MICO|nr:hypothetical protein [Microcella alkalica]MBA8848524.1 high-affinity Fe2+/Pb2+ permease [Microcella alkalica]